MENCPAKTLFPAKGCPAYRSSPVPWTPHGFNRYDHHRRTLTSMDLEVAMIPRKGGLGLLSCVLGSAEFARVATRLLVLVDALDKTVANDEAMAAAGLEFKNLLEQAPPPPASFLLSYSVPIGLGTLPVFCNQSTTISLLRSSYQRQYTAIGIQCQQQSNSMRVTAPSGRACSFETMGEGLNFAS
jgi:hypothetical protein